LDQNYWMGNIKISSHPNNIPSFGHWWSPLWQLKQHFCRLNNSIDIFHPQNNFCDWDGNVIIQWEIVKESQIWILSSTFVHLVNNYLLQQFSWHFLSLKLFSWQFFSIKKLFIVQNDRKCDIKIYFSWKNYFPKKLLSSNKPLP